MEACGFCKREFDRKELKPIQTRGGAPERKARGNACPQCYRMATSVGWEDAPQKNEEK